MYSSLPSFVLGFHGCDEKVRNEVLSGKSHLNLSKNKYDWLGNGVYFWENNPNRALEYANDMKEYPQRYNTKVEKPAVIGAIIDLGQCLNFLDSKYIRLLKEAYKTYAKACEVGKTEMLQNKIMEAGVPLKRDLDCIVVELYII